MVESIDSKAGRQAQLYDPHDLSVMAFTQLEMDLMHAVVGSALEISRGGRDPELRWASPHLDGLLDRFKRAP